MKMLNALALAAALLAAPVLAADEPKPGKAAEPTAEEKAAELRGEAVADVGRAADLAAFARDAKSPEALVIAGGMLLRADKTFAGKSAPLDAKPVDDKGKPVAAKADEAVPLKKQAEDLFDAARAMAAADPARTKALEELIKNAAKFEFAGGAERRPAVGGPRNITRTLEPNQTHTYTVGFLSGQQAAVAMTSTGPAKIQFDITHVKGTNLISLRGLNANYTWVPLRDRDAVRYVTITLQNVGARATTYTLTTN